MSSKYKDFFETARKEEKNQKNKKPKHVSFDDSYSLPKHVKSRDDVEKGFKEYLYHKEEDRRRGYISPPFEVSKVPSPIYGYHRPKKEEVKIVNYDKLRQDMKKEAKDYILYEDFVTEELNDLWRIEAENEMKESEDVKNRQVSQYNAKKLTKKSFGLNRTLASIMEEEKGGHNSERRNVPGLFDSKRD